jgi:hypothetical protein
LVYTTRNHPFWTGAQKKLSKKQGRLQRSIKDTLNGMMHSHKEDVKAFLIQQARAGLMVPMDEAEEGRIRPEADGDTIMSAAALTS